MVNINSKLVTEKVKILHGLTITTYHNSCVSAVKNQYTLWTNAYTAGCIKQMVTM